MSIELSAIKTLDNLGYTYNGNGVWRRPDCKEYLQHCVAWNTTVKPKEIDRLVEKAERLSEISKWFDFKKVAKVMEYLNWQWYKVGVPSEEKIRSFCLSSVADVYDKTYATMKPQIYNCGGFDISSGIEDDNTISISVKFVLADWDAFTPT